MTVRIIVGNCLDELRNLPSESVHCSVSSPPYWGLRDYGLDPSVWGGDPECQHEFLDEETFVRSIRKGDGLEEFSKQYRGGGKKAWAVPPINIVRGSCCKCGAWRGVLGLEPTPEMFVENMVEVYEEVRRVLRPDGIAWVNMGDCYATGAGAVGARPGGGDGKGSGVPFGPMIQPNRMPIPGLKSKDLVGVPWMLAFGLRRAGWYLRQDIIWEKPNPMPESTEDRCTKAHEYIFLLSKSERYFYDAEAIKEPGSTKEPWSPTTSNVGTKAAQVRNDGDSAGLGKSALSQGGIRNKRSVWTVATRPFPGAHFATFPPELIEPCVLAGTSERGSCPTCRAPWERVQGPKITAFHSGSGRSGNGIAGKGHPTSQVRADHDIRMGPVSSSETIGWYPTCRCDGLQALPKLPQGPRLVAVDPEQPTEAEKAALEVASEGWRVACAAVHEARRRLCEPAAKLRTVPCVVLDHFGGAGTTGLVADRAQRDAILIEMNPAYAEMARRRIEGDGGLFSAVAAE